MSMISAALILSAIAFPLLVGAWPALDVSLALVHLKRRWIAQGAVER